MTVQPYGTKDLDTAILGGKVMTISEKRCTPFLNAGNRGDKAQAGKL